MALLDWFPEILRLSTPHVHAGVAAACPCGRTLRSWSDVFPCADAARGFTNGKGPPRSGGKGSPVGAYLYAGPGRELAGWEHRRH